MGDKLSETFEKILREHGVEPAPAMVRALAQAAIERSAWWSDEQVANYVGTIRVDRVRQWCYQHGITERRPMTPAVEVRRGVSEMTGRGRGGGAPSHYRRKEAG